MWMTIIDVIAGATTGILLVLGSAALRSRSYKPKPRKHEHSFGPWDPVEHANYETFQRRVCSDQGCKLVDQRSV